MRARGLLSQCVMTLVGLVENTDDLGRFSSNAKQHLVSMMLSVQQQPQQHYHQQVRSPPSLHQLQTVTATGSPAQVAHRGNVIVSTTSNNNNSEGKTMQQQPQQQPQQQSQSQQKRKMYAQQTPYTTPHQPASVARRNARERNRVKQVNNGFATLRQHIPPALAQALGDSGSGNTSSSGSGNISSSSASQGGSRSAASKKLSKVETLKMAVEYIRNLQQLLDEHDSESGASSTSSGSSVGSPSPIKAESQSLGMSMSELQHHHHQHHHHQQPSDIKFELKSECISDDDVQDQLAHQHHYHHQVSPGQQQHHRQSPVYIPAPCSSEASSSPTPSFVSDASSAGGSQGYGANFTSAIYAPHADPGYDNYEGPMSPEDEELLDYLAFWPQGQ